MAGFEKELAVARAAAAEAGGIARVSYARLADADIGEKGVNDLVTVVDVDAQKTIVARIRSSFPEDYIIAEENLAPEVNEGRDPEGSRRWYIDPLDGTTNYIHSYPMFAVNIGLEIDRKMSLGVTYGIMREEMFYATTGSGAFLNGKPIRVSTISSSDRTLLGTGFPFRSRGYLDIYLESFKYFFNHSRGIRRAGSAALDFAYVAAGRLDAFWEMTLSPWDMAAGVVLIEEAGGRVTDFFRGRDYLDTGHVVATNGLLHDWMTDKLGEIFTKGQDYSVRE